MDMKSKGRACGSCLYHYEWGIQNKKYGTLLKESSNCNRVKFESNIPGFSHVWEDNTKSITWQSRQNKNVTLSRKHH
jgi:hypothetical protein